GEGLRRYGHRLGQAGCLRAGGQDAPRARRSPHIASQPRRVGHGRGPVASLNRLAFSATLHRLTGCAIGESRGLGIATALGWGNGASIAVAVVLAFVFGYSFTLVPLV